MPQGGREPTVVAEDGGRPQGAQGLVLVCSAVVLNTNVVAYATREDDDAARALDKEKYLVSHRVRDLVKGPSDFGDSGGRVD